MKTIQIRGSDVPLDLRAWTPNLRHFGSIVVMAAAALLLAVGLLVHFLAPAASAIVLYVLLAVLVLLLAFQAAIVALGMKAETAAPAASRPASGPSGPAAAPQPAATRTGFERPGDGDEGDDGADEGTVLTLKCGRCATEFDVTDTGERPLYHNCPGCGAEGVLRGEPAAAPKPQAEQKPAPEPERRPEPEPESSASAGFGRPESAAPGEAAKDPSPRKRLKLRCGGCKGIFQVEDAGKRPLRHRCPHCSRIGEIK